VGGKKNDGVLRREIGAEIDGLEKKGGRASFSIESGIRRDKVGWQQHQRQLRGIVVRDFLGDIDAKKEPGVEKGGNGGTSTHLRKR